jgi:hypothetical protein
VSGPLGFDSLTLSAYSCAILHTTLEEFEKCQAESDGKEGWREIAAKQLDWPSQDRLRVAGVWRRIWNEPNPDRPEI